MVNGHHLASSPTLRGEEADHHLLLRNGRGAATDRRTDRRIEWNGFCFCASRVHTRHRPKECGEPRYGDDDDEMAEYLPD